MLNPVNSLSKYATQRGLSDAVYAAKEAALLNALLHPLRTSAAEVDPFTRQPPDVVAVYAHGGAATRVIRDDKGYEVQEWHFGEDDWRRLKGFPAAPSGHAAACEYSKESSGQPLSLAEFVTRWKSLDSVGANAEPFESRLKMAEFFYDKQGIAWDDFSTNPWSHLTDVATVALVHAGEVPSVYDAKERSRIQDTLRNLQLAWGEIEPVAKTTIDAGPRYLVSVSSVTRPSTKLRPDAGHADTFGTKVDREWMSGEQLAATARRFGIDKASYPSPGFAEHVWWISTKPTVEGVLETSFQLDVHELSDATVGFREPAAEDFQRIANVIGVPFDAPMSVKAVVIQHDEFGVYLGNCLGLGFWSKLDPAGQPSAVTFTDEAEAKAHMESWEGGIPKGVITYPVVEADQQNGRYASLDACVRAGLAGWDVEESEAAHASAGPG